MAASDATVTKIVEVITRHVDDATLTKILAELSRVNGNASFRETIRRMIMKHEV